MLNNSYVYEERESIYTLNVQLRNSVYVDENITPHAYGERGSPIHLITVKLNFTIIPVISSKKIESVFSASHIGSISWAYFNSKIDSNMRS